MLANINNIFAFAGFIFEMVLLATVLCGGGWILRSVIVRMRESRRADEVRRETMLAAARARANARARALK